MQEVPKCPRCGVEVQPHWDQCEVCGYSPDDEASLPPPPPPPPSLLDAPPPGGGAPPFGAPGDDEPISFDLPPVDDAIPDDAPPPPPPPPPPGVSADPLAAVAPSPAAAAPAAPAFDPLSRWEAEAASAPAGAPPGDGPDPADDGRPGKRVTAADAAKARSPFELNKLVVAAAVVLAVLVLGWQAMSLLSSDSGADTAAPGSTLPPLGAIASTTVPLTTPDGVTIVPPVETTTTTSGQRPCDSVTSIFSTDGKGYTPCDGQFQVDFPGRADIKTSTSETAIGPVKWTSLSSTDVTTNPPVRSVVVYGQLPRELAPEEVESVQHELVSMLFATPGTMTTYQDLPALTFSATEFNGDQVEGIAFVNGTTAYAIAARSQGNLDPALNALRDTFTFR